MKHNPIELIMRDHRAIEDLFRQYEDAASLNMEGDRDPVRLDALRQEIAHELIEHAELEESVCYPQFKELLGDEGRSLVEEAESEHEEIKNRINDLQVLGDDGVLDEMVRRLKECVDHHVREEEHELLLLVESRLGEVSLEEMGEKIMAFKESALVHDHGVL